MVDLGSPTDRSEAQNIAAAITEVSERASILVHEEIELAKAEMSEKVTKLVKGAVVAAVAGVFFVTALMLFLNGMAWLVWWLMPVSNTSFFWGFFVVAVALLLLGVLAGFLAARALRAGSPPTPKMAIEEARRIRETVSSTGGEGH